MKKVFKKGLEAEKLANKYLDSVNAHNTTAEERMDTLINIPYVVKAGCGNSFSSYTLATGVEIKVSWENGW